MFSFARRSKDPDNTSSAPDADEAPRVAISETGMIVFANDSFRKLAALPERKAPVKASTFLRFPKSAGPLPALADGTYSLRLRGRDEPVMFHFEWLTMPDRQRYLIGTPAAADTDAGHDAAGVGMLDARDFPALAALSQDVMLVAGRTGKIVRVNDAFLRAFGFASLPPEKPDFTSLFHDADKPLIRKTIQALGLNGDAESQPLEFEARMIAQDGGERVMQWRFQQAHDGQIICIGHDITPIKQQQAALERREKQLSEAEAIGRMGHWHWTIGEENIAWSQELYRMFGVTPDTFQPTLLNMNRMVHKRDIDRVNQALQRAVIEQNDYDMEFRIRQPQGDIRYIRCEGRCAVDADGEAIALYGIMQDMTERILYERELKDAKNAAERAYAAKSQFLANMSHELRTPLNAVIGFSEMMQRELLGPVGTPQYLEYIRGIRESGEHLLDLINDILDMSKIEAGKYELALEDINVAKSIKLALHMMEGRAMEAHVALNFIGTVNEDLMIVADRRALLQIMLNLLSNAVKFTKAGGRVTLECHEKQDHIILKVSDTGIGIPANKLASITRPFEQVSTDYARAHQGSGLGLAITKELVEMHGGALHIESTVDVGTAVTIRLPADAGKARKAGKA